MARPEHLPDYAAPPIIEVVTGVQFEEVSEFLSVHLNDIWDLYRDEFPKVEERPPLEPVFETFGAPSISRQANFKLSLGNASQRLWFISEDEDHLIQFQPDRLLLNWRDRPDKHYPRYEACADSFMKHPDTLSIYFEKKFKANIRVNQIEISYINIIEVDDFSDTGKWISLFSENLGEVEHIEMKCSEVINNASGQPYARLSHEFASAYENKTRQKAIQWTITYRGSPKTSGVSDIRDLLMVGRELIVKRFDEHTTLYAHQQWGKK